MDFIQIFYYCLSKVFENSAPILKILLLICAFLFIFCILFIIFSIENHVSVKEKKEDKSKR